MRRQSTQRIFRQKAPPPPRWQSEMVAFLCLCALPVLTGASVSMIGVAAMDGFQKALGGPPLYLGKDYHADTLDSIVAMEGFCFFATSQAARR